MKPSVSLTYQDYVIALPHAWPFWSTFERTFRDVLQARRRVCLKTTGVCLGCRAAYHVHVRRRQLTLERALEMRHFVNFRCALPARARLRAPSRGFFSSSSTTTLLDLPNEMLVAIMLEVCVSTRHFRLHDVAAMAACSQRLFSVAKTPLLWRRVTERLYAGQPELLPDALELVSAYFQDPKDSEEPWKWANVAPRFGIVRSQTPSYVISHIVRDDAGTVLEYTRETTTRACTYRRYDISEFGWRLGAGVQFASFYINVDYVRARPTTRRAARFEIFDDAEFDVSNPHARRAFFARYTHQVAAP